MRETEILPAKWVAVGSCNEEGMVNAWLCGVALGLMVLGREEEAATKVAGRPSSRLWEWFPGEYTCSKERISRINVYQMAGR
jgi:hypothetical protein